MKKELSRGLFSHGGSARDILPPHILRSIAEKGTSRQRTRALQTMAMDNTFRAIRAGAQPKAPLPKTRARALALEGQKQRTIYDAHHTQTLPGTVVRTEGGQPGSPSTTKVCR
jgi:hypothetical protein